MSFKIYNLNSHDTFSKTHTFITVLTEEIIHKKCIAQAVGNIKKGGVGVTIKLIIASTIQTIIQAIKKSITMA